MKLATLTDRLMHVEKIIQEQVADVQEVNVIESDGGDDTCLEMYLEVVNGSGKSAYLFVNILVPESDLFSYVEKSIHIRPTRDGRVDPAPTLDDLLEELQYAEED